MTNTKIAPLLSRNPETSKIAFAWLLKLRWGAVICQLIMIGAVAMVFDTVIPRNVRLGESPSFGKPVLLYDIDSTGSRGYLQLAQELLRKSGRRGGAKRR